MLSQLNLSTKELLENCFVKEVAYQVYWPCQHDPEVKIPGPKLVMIEGNYWIAENAPNKKYSRIEELLGDLAFMEEARRIRAVQDDFDDKLKAGFFDVKEQK